MVVLWWVTPLLGIDVKRLDNKFKGLEAYQGLRVDGYYVIRLDGVRFGRVLSEFEKPRSRIVHEALVEAARSVAEWFNCNIAYVVSDELNIVCLSDPPYGGRVEKLVSISAGIASAVVSVKLGKPVYFDARLIRMETIYDAAEYLVYRARVGLNNFLSQLYHMRYGGRVATPRLLELVELLARELRSYSPWMAVGTCLQKVETMKVARNVLTGEEIVVKRRRWVECVGPWGCVERLLSLGR